MASNEWDNLDDLIKNISKQLKLNKNDNNAYKEISCCCICNFPSMRSAHHNALKDEGYAIFDAVVNPKVDPLLFWLWTVGLQKVSGHPESKRLESKWGRKFMVSKLSCGTLNMLSLKLTNWSKSKSCNSSTQHRCFLTLARRDHIATIMSRGPLENWAVYNRIY